MSSLGSRNGACPLASTKPTFVLRLSPNEFAQRQTSLRALEDKLIVEDLSFELAAGERLSVLGPNGAGKTVLLKALLNLLPYKGEVVWAPNVRIGYVPQKIDADTHLPLTFTRSLPRQMHDLESVVQRTSRDRE